MLYCTLRNAFVEGSKRGVRGAQPSSGGERVHREHTRHTACDPSVRHEHMCIVNEADGVRLHGIQKRRVVCFFGQFWAVCYFWGAQVFGDKASMAGDSKGWVGNNVLELPKGGVDLQ